MYPHASLTLSILAAAIRVQDTLGTGWALEDLHARRRGVHGATSDQARYGRGRPATHGQDAEAPAAPGRAALALRARVAGQGLVRWVEIPAPTPR
jgi:hypothetical protein